MNFRAVLLLVGVVAFIILPNLIQFLIEWLWFGASGYRDVYVTSLRAQASLGAFILGFSFAMLYGNMWIAISSIASPYIVIGTGGAGTVQPSMIRREQIRKVVGIGSLVVSLMISLAASGEWMRLLQFRHGVPFGVADPILGHDIGFYVFRLPLLDLVQQVAVAVVVVSLIGSAAAYVLAGALNFTKRGGVSVVRKARLHLSLLAAAFFLLLAASAYLEIPHLLTDVAGPGIVPGASYADVMARMPAARVLTVVAVLSAGLAAYHAFSSRRMAHSARPRVVSRHLDWRIAVRGGDSAFRRDAKRAGGGDALHDAQHRGDTAGLQSCLRTDTQLLRRRRPDARGHRPQRRYAQERASLGSPAAARDVRPDPGAAHLLRLRVGRQRPLHD